MASPPNPLRILEETIVSPPLGTPPASLPLNFFDAAWLYTGPVERLFFYPSPNPAAHFPALKSSLAIALGSFPPLAGRVRPPSTPNQPLHIEYCVGHSVSLTLSESDDDFSQLCGSDPLDFARLNPLIPQLVMCHDSTMPLLAAQVTIFQGFGLCVGIAVHHVACDDSSSIHFLKSWAMLCKSPTASLLASPSYSRNVIADPNKLYSKILEEMQSYQPPVSTPAAPVETSVFATFTLDRQKIENLKLQALARAGRPFHCSTFVVACAFAWACLLKAEGRLAGGAAHLLFSVECRGRLVPPLPAEYFGNCLRPCFVEVTGSLDDSEVFPAEAIGRAVEGLVEQGVLDGAEGWMKKILTLVTQKPMSVAGSPKYGVYHTDFGWGRPVNVKMVSIQKTPGTISLAESRDELGGIEIGLVLPRPEMNIFQSSFLQAL